jgi:hypothetical protein
MVTVLLKPYHLRGQLRDSLGRAVQWAAQRKGQLQQTAEQVSTIYGGQLRDSLGRAVQWAAQRKGQLQATTDSRAGKHHLWWSAEGLPGPSCPVGRPEEGTATTDSRAGKHHVYLMRPKDLFQCLYAKQRLVPVSLYTKLFIVFF